MASKKKTSWRQTKMFALEAFRILRPDADFKSASLPDLFGIEAVEVTSAHAKAAKSEVSSWKSRPEAAEAITERVAWWLALGDALVLAGIGPHEGERKGRETGLSPAIDYAKRTRFRDDIVRPTRAKNFLRRAGFDPDNFDLPAAVRREADGGNALARRGRFESVQPVAPVAPAAPAAPAAAPAAPSADEAKLVGLAKALKAAGFSLAEIVEALQAT